VLRDCTLHPFPFSVLTTVPEPKVWEEEFDLNSVRLCFQASITLPTGELFPLEPVVSQPIYDNSELRNKHVEAHYLTALLWFSGCSRVLSWDLFCSVWERTGSFNI